MPDYGGPVAAGLERPRMLEQCAAALEQNPLLYLACAVAVAEAWLSTSSDLHRRQLSWLLSVIGCSLGVAVCAHRRALARARLSAAAERFSESMAVRRDLCFSDAATRESYERWCRLTPLSITRDWLNVPFGMGFHLQLAQREACGLVHQGWGGVATALNLFRLAFRGRLSLLGYSVPGLALIVYAWTSQPLMLLRGDVCIANLMSGLPRDSKAGAALDSCLSLLMTALSTPVSQSYVTPKVFLNWLGCTLVVYLRTSLRTSDGDVDPALDAERWGLLLQALCTAACSIVYFLISISITEADMMRFMALQQARQRQR